MAARRHRRPGAGVRRVHGHVSLSEASDTGKEAEPMRAAIGVILSALIIAAPSGHKPAREVDRYLNGLPKELRLKEETPQRYQFTCDYFQVTPAGDPIRKQRVSAEYVRSLPNDRVRWSNVTVAEA